MGEEMKCENCKWYDLFGPVDEDKPDDGTEGFCHKYAPRIVQGMLFQAPDMPNGQVDRRQQEFPDCWDNQSALWPKTFGFWWCGEFEKK